MASLVDTHAHLADEAFAADLPEVLERAREAGVRWIVTIGISAASSQRCVELAERYPCLAASVGIQPNYVAQAQPGDWDTIVRLADHPRVTAIGETGLDRYWDFTPFDQQEELFQRHLTLARAKGLPVVIHCRAAEQDVLRVLREENERHGLPRGVMHSFTGDAATLRACLDLGLSISFAGMLTYPSGAALRLLAKDVPLERLLIETDSPYLPPVPVRKRVRRNEPAYLPHTLDCLAQALAMDPTELADLIFDNASQLFSRRAA